jgi:hypothetical protein
MPSPVTAFFKMPSPLKSLCSKDLSTLVTVVTAFFKKFMMGIISIQVIKSSTTKKSFELAVTAVFSFFSLDLSP